VPFTTGEVLVRRGVASQAQVEQAAQEAKARGERLCSRLLEMGLPEGALAAALAARHELPGVDLSHCIIDLALLDLVPRQVAEQDCIMPLSDEGGRLHLAMASPNDERVLSEVRFVTGREVSPYVCVLGAAATVIRQAYDAREAGAHVWRGAAAGPGLPPLVATLLPEAVPAEGAAPLTVEDGDLIPVETEVSTDIEIDEPIEVSEPEAAEVVATVRADGRRTVLVVDDEPEIRQLVQRTLENHGFAVETAADGAEAIEKCEALVPDLVLLDAMLPKVHGFEACRRMKSSPRTRHVPVIMMTAIYRGWRFAQDARDTFGAEDYIEKPFRLEDFLRRIEAVLESTSARPRAGAEAAAPHLQRGRELALGNQLPLAQKEFEAAIQADPWSAEAHALLARTLRARGDVFAAMTSYERAAELKPGHLPILRSLAALYEEKGFRRKAAETLERAMAAAGDEATRAALKQRLSELLG
jgi:DNA-binding response OmpR family regulator